MAARIKCRRDEPVGRHFRLGSGADQAYWPTAEYPQADSFQYTGGNDSRSLPTIATPLGICRLLRAHVHLPGHRLCASASYGSDWDYLRQRRQLASPYEQFGQR